MSTVSQKNDNWQNYNKITTDIVEGVFNTSQKNYGNLKSMKGKTRKYGQVMKTMGT